MGWEPTKKEATESSWGNQPDYKLIESNSSVYLFSPVLSWSVCLSWKRVSGYKVFQKSEFIKNKEKRVMWSAFLQIRERWPFQEGQQPVFVASRQRKFLRMGGGRWLIGQGAIWWIFYLIWSCGANLGQKSPWQQLLWGLVNYVNVSRDLSIGFCTYLWNYQFCNRSPVHVC